MADKTINVNIIDRSVPIKNPVNIAVVNVPNPAMNVTVDGNQLYNLINIPKYFITDATTGTPITGSNYEDYFPSGGGGGGGGGSITIDNFPTEGSGNAVSSGGTYSFVNSSISTNTANFIGTFSSVADLEAYSGELTNNDYAFVIGTDASGNTKYDRYKYTDASDPASWEYEYTLNNSSFTAAEWATIQSGLTSSDKTTIDNAAGKKVAGTIFTKSDDTTVTAGTGAEQFNTYTTNQYTDEGTNIAAGNYSHAEGYGATAEGNYSHAEGCVTIAGGDESHAEGHRSIAGGLCSHAEGYYATAEGSSSHSEGSNTSAVGLSSHAEGDGCNAYGAKSHAEGLGTTTGDSSDNTKGLAAHVEGNGTIASGAASHAEGHNTTASGDYSHAEGYYTKASSDNQHVEGKYNVEDTQDKYAHIIGCGTATNDRKNAYCVDWSGKIYQPQDPNADTNGVYLSSKAKASDLVDIVDNGVKNMFNLDAWKSVTVSNGSITVSGNTVTLTATSNNCFTSYNLPPNGSYPYNAVMIVNEGDKIVFTWNYTANNNQTNDKVYLFRNGSAATGNFIQVSASTQILEYTVPADTSYITIRFDVGTSGYSADFSNIMVCKKECYNVSQSYQPYKYDPYVDLIPAENSMNPITSDGAYQYILENINYCVKNISRWSGGTATSSGQTIASKIPITTDGDTYVISYATSLTTGYITVGIKDANDALVVNAIQIDNFGTKTATVTIPSNAAYFNVVSSVAGTYSNFMICKKKLYNLSDDYRPYAPSNSELYSMLEVTDAATTAAQAEADAVANAGAKNMLTLNPPSTSSGGVTLAVNTDGTITTTGGTSSSYTALILNNSVILPAGEYILSGCPTGGGDNTYRLDISGTQYYDTGSGVKFTSTGTAMTIRIRIGANTSVNGFIWKPMIRNAAIADSTFQQYAPTNRELYEMIGDINSVLEGVL